MPRPGRRGFFPLALAGCITIAFAPLVCAQATAVYTWEMIREKFRATNPALQAAQLSVSESRAAEITAYLRPNPDFTSTIDQIDPFSTNPYRPLGNILPAISFSYLH